MKEKLRFGSVSVQKLCSMCLVLGIIVVAVLAVLNGIGVYNTSTYMRMVQMGDWMQGEETQNLPLAIFAGLGTFLLGSIIWRVICEILYIVLRFFKSNTKNEIA